MDNTIKKQNELSAAKRALLEKRLKGHLSKPVEQPKIIKATKGPAPLSFAQEQMWLMDEFNPGNSSNNAPSGYKIIGDFDVALFQKCLNEIIRRHAIFRTTFKAIDGKPFQIIADQLTLEIPVEDLQHLSGDHLEQEIQRLLMHEGKKPFVLNEGPLVRAKLFQFSPNGYFLLFATHHIISDGWSMGVFWREMASLYENYKQGKPSTLSELPMQYADYAVRQKENMQGGQYEKQVAYWKQQLNGKLPVLDWATDRPRPPIQRGEGSKAFVEFPSELLFKARQLNKEERCTLNMFLVSILQTLIFKYTGEEDVMVGSPTAGRNSSDVVDIFGIFFNMLIFRTDLSGNPSFRELLARVRKISLDAYDNQDVPFEMVVKEVKPERDLSRNPLIQVYIQALKDVTPNFPGLELSRINFDSGTSQMDLAINVFESENGLRGYFEYNTDLFDAETIDRMVMHFQNLMESAVNNPDLKISELNILSADERDQLLNVWNQSSAQYQQELSIHQLFERQAEQTPQLVAVEAGGLKITYKELNEKANQLAAYLQKFGVGPEVMVGFCMERSIDMMVGLLAVLKAGGAYVPMDPSFPHDRLAYMIEDSGISTLVTQEDLLDVFPGYQGETICIDRDWSQIGSGSTVNSKIESNSENLAYVIYTSGSTGKPKGVQICHRPVVNFLQSMQKEPGLVQQDVLVAVTTLSFDIAVLELFLPLITGAKLVIANKQEVADGNLLIELLDHSKATVMQATPSTWRLLLEAGWKNMNSVKMLCGGEALPRNLANQLLEHGEHLWNMYGPTETTIWSAVKRIEKEDGPVLIGPPIANTQFHILDRFMNPVPIGVPGELYIGGDGLARGYLNREELTNERFVANPFHKGIENRLYRTGDLVRYRPNGNIEFQGRLDYQVKVRGYRIELGEIEQVLNSHGAINEAVVTVREDIADDKRLVAYLVSESNQDIPETGILKDFLREKLPEYMIPSVFVSLQEFPKTPNGKIDRKSLPAPVTSDIKTEKEFVASRDETEAQLTEVWEDILGVKPIGMHDNFFDLGGHSLMAAKLFAEIEKRLQKKIPLATLFQAQNIEQLAEYIRGIETGKTWSSLVPIQTKGTKPPLFLVHGAEGNVLLYRSLSKHLGEDQPVYGLQAQGLDGSGNYLTSFEDMAAHYIKEIKAVQKEGPYHLGGYCLGGQIAYEMGIQLQQKGEKVSLIALLEAYNTYTNPEPSAWYLILTNKLLKLAWHVESLLTIKAEYKWPFFIEKFRIEKARIKETMSYLISRVKNANNSENNTHVHVLVSKVTHQAQKDYVPKKYPGKVILYRPKRQGAGMHSPPNYGWNGMTKALDIHVMPVQNHGSLVEPFVQILSEKLTEDIRKVAKEPLLEYSDNHR